MSGVLPHCDWNLVVPGVNHPVSPFPALLALTHKRAHVHPSFLLGIPLQMGGIQSTDGLDEPMRELYFLGIIDFLQLYNNKKKVGDLRGGSEPFEGTMGVSLPALAHTHTRARARAPNSSCSRSSTPPPRHTHAHLRCQAENIYKSFRFKSKGSISSVPPAEYGDRFLAFVCEQSGFDEIEATTGKSLR